MFKRHNPPSVAPPGPYSHGVEAPSGARTLYMSGQVGQKPDGSMAEGITEQTKVAFTNLMAILAEAGMTAGNLVKLTIYLTDETNIGGFMKGAGPFLPNPPPAITLVYVKALASPAMLVEVEGIGVG
jgi:enamine deaminase RidA (YjgF/YER057c/UK114 family)